MYVPLVLKTDDFSSFVLDTVGEEFDDFSSALSEISALLPDQDDVSVEEEADFLQDVLGKPRELGEAIVYFVRSFWVRSGELVVDPSGRLSTSGHILPLMMEYRGAGRQVGFLYAIYSGRPMSFPFVSTVESLYSTEAVFVPLSPESFGYDVPEDLSGGFFFFKAIDGEEVSGPDIYGFYPWDIAYLPTAVSMFYSGQVGKEGPVSILITPELAELSGGVPRVIKAISGYETLGMPVFVSFGNFDLIEEEEEE